MANLTFSFERKKGSITPGDHVDGIGTTAYSYDQVGQILSEGGLWPNDTVNYTYHTGRVGVGGKLPHPTTWQNKLGRQIARSLKKPYGLESGDLGLFPTGGYLGDVGSVFAGEGKGAAANLSFGLYKPCYTSPLQRQGGFVGVGLAMAGESLGGWSAAGKAARGLDYSRWVPARAIPGGRGSALDNLTKALKLNGNFVSRAEHALSDPYSYRFMPRAWKDLNPMPNAFRQQLNRVPFFPLGMAAAAAGGNNASLNSGGCH